MDNIWIFKKRLQLLIGIIVISVAVFFIFNNTFTYIWPFVVGAGLAVLLEKPITKVKKFTWNKHSIAAVLVIGTIVIISALIVVVFVWLIYKEVIEFIADFDYRWVRVQQEIAKICLNVDSFFKIRSGTCMDFLCKCGNRFERMISVENVAESVTDVIGGAANICIPMFKNIGWFFAKYFLMVLSAIYISKDLDKFREWKKNTVFSDEIGCIIQGVRNLTNVYFRVQLIILLINSTLCVVTFFIIKNPYALVLGLVIGLLDALPIFGTGTVLVPWAIVKLLMKDYMTATILLLLFAVTYVLREVVESKYISEKMGMAPLTILASMFIGLMLYGVTGFILGPISYCIIKALVSYLKSVLESDKIASM